MHTADVDGDIDVLAANDRGIDVYCYRSNGGGICFTRVFRASAAGARTVRTADMDRGWTLDIVTTSLLDRTLA